MSNNKGLTKLPIFINWTPHINTIYFCNCNIDRLNELFLLKQQYTNLENIDLSYNQILDFIQNDDITPDLMCKQLPLVKTLNLS